MLEPLAIKDTFFLKSNGCVLLNQLCSVVSFPESFIAAVLASASQSNATYHTLEACVFLILIPLITPIGDVCRDLDKSVVPSHS